MSPFTLGKGKYKHRISEDPDFKKSPHVMRSYRLDQETINALDHMVKLKGMNRSALVRLIVQKAHEEMTNAEHMA